MIQLLGQMAKEKKACTPLLYPTNILMDVVGHNGLDLGLPSLEKLIKSITVLFMFHIKLVFTISSNVNFQVIVDLPNPI
jgi:hypothetical protein